jgi:hypothetical protein
VKQPGREVEMKTLGTVVVILVVLTESTVGAQDGRAATTSLPKASFGKLPIYFIENRGAYPDEVAYYVQGSDKTLFFTKHGVTFRLEGKDRDWVVKLDCVGANPEARAVGLDRQQAVFSYFRGPEKDWKTGLRTFSKIVYRDLWPGIDLVYRAGVGVIKYEFLVAPGADPAEIRLRYRGVTSLTTTDAGALRVETPEGGFEDAPPEAWQEMDGERVQVGMRFRLDPDPSGDAAEFGFGLGDYDRTRSLVLDPAVLVYCGFIGGNGDDQGDGVAVDAGGNVYVTGRADSTAQTFPIQVGPILAHRGGTDAFVAKVNSDGTGLVYCGYIGGARLDCGWGIAVDLSGNAYVAGTTESDEQTFPVKVGPDLTFNGGFNAFVAKVNAAGTGLDYCGYAGGGGFEDAFAIAVDAAGCAYVTGDTYSAEPAFPVKVGPDLTYNGGSDAFVAKVNAAGTGFVYCGYIGGNGDDYGESIEVDSAGSAYVTGSTRSTEPTFPVKVGPDLTYNGGFADAFVAKVNPAGTALVYCGYIGGSATDWGSGIAVDTTGNAYITGHTGSSEQTFPVTAGPGLTFSGGGFDAFAAKVNSLGTGLAYCGYIGGNGNDQGKEVAVDAAGSAYVTGWTDSTEQTFPVTVGPDVTHNFRSDGFVAKVDSGGRGLVYCGYIGGNGDDQGKDVAVDAAGNAYVTGSTNSTEQTFPVTVGPDVTGNGVRDAFVAKVALLDDLTASGLPRPGSTITLNLRANEVRGSPYQLGTSLGTGPIPIDTRRLDLSPDSLLLVAVNDYWPTVFSGYRGVLDGQGQAKAAVNIPNIPALIGIRLHTAFVTVDPKAPSGIKSISNTFSFVIAK